MGDKITCDDINKAYEILKENSKRIDRDIEIKVYTRDLIKTIFRDIEKIIIDHYSRGLPTEMMLRYIDKYKERVLESIDF